MLNFVNLKEYYSVEPNDIAALNKFRKNYEIAAKHFRIIFGSFFKENCIFEVGAEFLDKAIYVCNHRRALDITLVVKSQCFSCSFGRLSDIMEL